MVAVAAVAIVLQIVGRTLTAHPGKTSRLRLYTNLTGWGIVLFALAAGWIAFSAMRRRFNRTIEMAIVSVVVSLAVGFVAGFVALYGPLIFQTR